MSIMMGDLSVQNVQLASLIVRDVESYFIPTIMITVMQVPVIVKNARY